MAASKQISVPRELSSQELTDNEKKILARRYEILLKQYKSKIVQLADNPINIVNALNNQQVLSNKDIHPVRTYIRNFPLRKHQNEALFQILSWTSYEDLNRIKEALHESQNIRLENIFDIIGNRLQASVDKHITVKAILPIQSFIFGDGEQDPSSRRLLVLEEINAVRRSEFETLTCLHRAAIEGDYKAVKDILKDPKYKEMQNWFTPDTNKSPIHYAALGENSKDSLTFTKTLIEVATSKGIIARPLGESDEDVVDGAPSLPFQWTLEGLINHEDSLGHTALHMATEQESVQFVEYLCDQGANILKRNVGITPLELMYDKTPDAVVHLLNGALSADSNSSKDGNLNVKMDFRAIIGSASDDPDKSNDTSNYNEMELLANMVFRNYKESLKTILPHVVVKAFLDLKWKKFRAALFFYTTFYVLMHLWFTCFVIQVFIVRYPFRPAPANETATGNGGQDEEKLTFFGYIRGNWKAVPPHVLIDDNNPLPPMLYEQGIALIGVGAFLFLIEVIECLLILKVTTYTRKTNLYYRHIVLSSLLIVVAVYNENMEAIIIGLFILLLHIYDEINSQNKRVRCRKMSCELASTETFILLIVTVTLYLMVIFRSFMYYDVIVTGAVATFNFFVFVITFFGGNYEVGTTNKTRGCATNLFNWFVSFVHSVKYFFVRVSAYLASVENILQLVFIALMISVSTVVCQNEISSWYYLCAAFSVVLAWTLILMQIGNIYGIGVYVQIFKTVLRRFSYVMSTYSVMLIAFSISFSIIFPEEKLFTTLPASFFRVVSMMVGELNFDDIFNKEEESLRAFPYATQWIHTGFIVSVTVVLVNLLIGLTVSDIEKIFEISDVIHRSIQIERLYIMERLYLDVPIFRWLNRGNIYVVPQEKDREKGQGLEISVGIKELPKALHKEIRLLAENREDYTQTYLQK
ncbi:unnamed protein product [Allacma fusca]|uniref:Uncharacterized protein n=1 Tax=Allacma fusca TaxID=39272 RepID=A0A8J2P7T4_9HEXA|nr:unnamed protein product [Allacma fusca]